MVDRHFPSVESDNGKCHQPATVWVSDVKLGVEPTTRFSHGEIPDILSWLELGTTVFVSGELDHERNAL